MGAYLTISLIALLASALTFFSGFGLGTLLLPAFAWFMPVEIAVAATAVVHLVNSLFKAALMGRHADRSITLVFAGFSVLGALVGAWVLAAIVGQHVLTTYTLAGTRFDVTLVKVVVGAMMVAFAVLELAPTAHRWGLPRRLLWAGGLVSGFFGGLSGHQGALRSAFLVRTELSKDALVGTRAVCAVAVDVSRLLVYAAAAAVAAESADAPSTLRMLHDHNARPIIATGCAAALAGSLVGKRVLKEVTITAVRTVVAVALLALGIAVGVGLV